MMEKFFGTDVSSVMTIHLVTVGLDDPLAVVNEIFEKAHFHHLLVVENNKLCGVISDRDLFKALSPNLGTIAEKQSDAATLNKKVHQIMSRKLVFLNGNASVREALELFHTHEISCIPVVDEKNKPLGILSWRDVFKLLNTME